MVTWKSEHRFDVWGVMVGLDQTHRHLEWGPEVLCEVMRIQVGSGVFFLFPMDWFKGKFTGLSPIFNGKIYGFL